MTDPTITDEELAEIAALPTEVERTSRLIAALRAEQAGAERLRDELAVAHRLANVLHAMAAAEQA